LNVQGLLVGLELAACKELVGLDEGEWKSRGKKKKERILKKLLASALVGNTPMLALVGLTALGPRTRRLGAP
jgi:hypothetical protein